MIHTLLPLRRPLIFFDTETTGVDTEHDRIWELSFQLYTAEGLKTEWSARMNPGVPISNTIRKVCKLTDDDIADIQSKPPFKYYAANLAKGFTDCDFAGKNIRFDLRIFRAEMDRADVLWSQGDARLIDAERLEAIAIPRSLSHLYKKYTGREHEGAHGSMDDVRASVDVVVAQLETHAVLPRDIQELHTLSFPGMIDSEGKFKFVDGMPTCQFGKFKGKPMSAIDPGYWRNFILDKKNSFSAEIKAIAMAALAGNYPRQK